MALFRPARQEYYRNVSIARDETIDRRANAIDVFRFVGGQDLPVTTGRPPLSCRRIAKSRITE